MCFQEPFKNINDDGSGTATIQTLWYVTIQEATKLGWWHKEPAESLDLARGAGFFPGLIQERVMLEGVSWSHLLVPAMHRVFLQLHDGTVTL